MRKVSYSEALNYYKFIINQYGGTYGIKDSELLKSSLELPFSTFDEVDLYDTDLKKIAILTYSIIKNHSLTDGNKRLGVYLMILHCDELGLNLNCNNDELIEFGLGVASGEYNKDNIENWLKSHMDVE